MSSTQLHPLLLDPETGEPYLRLPSPHDNIIITPPRLSDAAGIVQNMNDPAVYTMLQGPPFPYLLSHANEWLSVVKAETDEIIRELQQAGEDHPTGPPITVGGCPVRYIREIQEDGTQVMLGDIGFLRCPLHGITDSASRDALRKENEGRKVGDPDIVWCVGNHIAPSHHGKGIMTAVFRTLLNEWAIPRMGVRKMRVETFIDNMGSVRVFEKNGFVREETITFDTVIPSGRTVHGLHVLWWHHK